MHAVQKLLEQETCAELQTSPGWEIKNKFISRVPSAKQCSLEAEQSSPRPSDVAQAAPGALGGG